MNIVRRANDRVRRLFAMGAGKLAIGRGVRTAFALLVPVIVGDLLNQPLFSWAALGGWLGSLADKGGSYRTRAATMGALAILGSACALAGTETAHSVPLAIIAMFIVGVLGGLARVYGDEGSTVGLFIAVIFAVATGSPSSAPHASVLRAEMFLGGVVWAMVLSLVLWPLHPFRPARRTVAKSYRTLADFAHALEAVTRALDGPDALAAREHARAFHAQVRSALEEARLALSDVRKPKQGRSPRGEQLLVLTEGSEQLFGTLVAIDAELEAASESGATIGDDAFARALDCLAQTLALLANAVDDTVAARRVDAARQPTLSGLTVREDWPNVHLRAAATLLSRIVSDVQVMLDTAANIDVRASSVVSRTAEHPVAIVPTSEPFAWLRPLRESLTMRSLPLRHGLRMGVAAAAAVWLSSALDITRGYWATITTLIVLQPYAGATLHKTLQRVGGSVLGGIIAAALAVVARTKLAIAGVMVPFTVGAVAVLPLNYGVFVLLLTPVFVLLAEPHPGDWGIAGLRVVNTILGGIVAFAASQLLWPTHELSAYPSQLASVIRDLRALLGIVSRETGPTSPQWRTDTDEARRRFGLAVTNAEATMQRLITEDSANPLRVEAAMTVTTYGRRMASTLAAIAEARTRDSLAMPASDTAQLIAGLDVMVASLEGSVMLPQPEIALAAPTQASDVSARTLQDAQIERLRAQLAVLWRAVARYQAA
ncbi:MAG TPA: FUSC family protein [Gemmatimonadaceae bacterium]|nr:FUSC family protein [Gemmatimonadaceae bacterium]